MAPPKRPWFRLYAEMIWDTKIRSLTPTQRWLWVTLLAIARQSPVPGTLLVTESLAMDETQIADAAAMKPGDVKRGLTAISALGLIEWNGDTWAIPRWKDRQYESDVTANRMTKHRHNSVTTMPDVTSPETETEESRYREQKTDRARARNIEAAKWKPTPELIEWVSREHPELDIVAETEKFIDHFSANGKPMKDWNAAWRNWMRRSREFQVAR